MSLEALLLLLCASSFVPCHSAPKTVSLTSPAVPRRYSLQRGVDRGPDCSHNASLGPALRGMGTTLIRTHDAGVLDWCVLFPSPTADPSLPSSYNFAPGDAYFAQITGEGFSPYLRLGWSWTVPQPSCIHPDPAVFAAVAVRTLMHYNDGWASGFTGQAVSLIELFNEPDEPRFWNGTAAEFYTLFDSAARALKAYNSSLQVGGPGVASPLAPASLSYSLGLLDYIQAHRTPVDFFSWHSYGDIASSGWGHSPQAIYNDTLTVLRSALQQRGLGRLQQHITEWQPVILGNASTTGSAEAASFTASALTFMALAQDVAVSIFYPACEGVGADGSWGMFLDAGNGTLAWRREGRAWGAVGALLQATPWALTAALAPAEADYTALAGSDSPEEAQRTTVSAVLSARASQTEALVVSAVLGRAAAAAGVATLSIYLLSSAVSAEGQWSNSTVQVAQDGRVQVSVPGFAPPAVAWVTLSALPAAPAPAPQWRSLLLSPPGPSEDGLYLSPLHYNHTLDGPAYSSPSQWYVAQWDGVQQLNASQAVAGAGPCPVDASPLRYSTLWHVQGQGGLLCLQRSPATGQRALLLVQSGAALPCGAEYDLFLAPTDSAYSNAPPNLQPVQLAHITQLRAQLQLQLLAFSSVPRCGPAHSCGPSGQLDYGYVTLGLVLSSAHSGSAGTIFYQVVLGDTRAAPSCAAQDPCLPYSFWYGSAPTVGVSESVASGYHPAQCLKPGAPAQAMDLPLYQRLAWAVQEGAARYGLNASLSAWQLTGIYLGSGMEGSASTQLRMGGLQVLVL